MALRLEEVKSRLNIGSFTVDPHLLQPRAGAEQTSFQLCQGVLVQHNQMMMSHDLVIP